LGFDSANIAASSACILLSWARRELQLGSAGAAGGVMCCAFDVTEWTA
jgi:hypothetical protein